MKRIKVIKFGGTSISDLGYEGIAKKIKEQYSSNKVICVLSAESGSTNQLIHSFDTNIKKYASEAASQELSNKSLREYDLLVSSGETHSVVYASIAAKGLGLKSTPLTGWQAGIVSSNSHKFSSINSIDVKKIRLVLKQYDVIFVAGFQAFNHDGYITTLGRGASDLTAIAIASALGEKDATIYTDVDALFTADPRVVNIDLIKPISHINYEEALELASFGGKVIHDRAVSVAQRFCVKINIKHYLKCAREKPGTIISSRFDTSFSDKKSIIKGVVFRDDIVSVSAELDNSPGTSQKLFEFLTKEDVNPTNILQSISKEKSAVEFFIDRDQENECLSALKKLKDLGVINGWLFQGDLSEFSIVGSMLETEKGFMKKLTDVMHNNGVKIRSLFTSGVRVSIITAKDEGALDYSMIYEGLSSYM